MRASSVPRVSRGLRWALVLAALLAAAVVVQADMAPPLAEDAPKVLSADEQIEEIVRSARSAFKKNLRIAEIDADETDEEVAQRLRMQAEADAESETKEPRGHRTTEKRQRPKRPADDHTASAQAAALADIQKAQMASGVAAATRVVTEIGKPRLVFGREGQADDELMQPWRTSVLPNGDYIVVDSANHRLSVYSPEGKYKWWMGGQGNDMGDLFRPRDIQVLRNGSILVLDRFNSRIVRFNEDGEAQSMFKAGDALAFAVAPDTHDVYMTETYWKQVQHFTSDGSFKRKITIKGSNAVGKLDDMQGITVLRNGSLAIVDTNNHRIVVASPTGQYEGMYDNAGSQRGQLFLPYAVAEAPDGNLFVASFGLHRISVFSPTWELLHEFGTQGEEPGQFSYPTGVHVTDDYRVIVTEMASHRVQVF